MNKQVFLAIDGRPERSEGCRSAAGGRTEAFLVPGPGPNPPSVSGFVAGANEGTSCSSFLPQAEETFKRALLSVSLVCGLDTAALASLSIIASEAALPVTVGRFPLMTRCFSKPDNALF